MTRSVARQFLTLMLILVVPCTHAADGSVVIEAPAEGAKLKSQEKNQLVFAVNHGRKGDHVHVYVDGTEIATLHRTKGAYALEDLEAGPREICIKVVNKENAGSFREFFENERVFVSPVLRWNISASTQATFELQYKHVVEPEGTGIPAIGDRPAPLPRETNLGEPGVENRFDDLLIGFNWSHAFNDNWTLRHRFNADFQDEDRSAIFGELQADNRTFNRFFTFNKGPQDVYYTTLDLTGKFATWGLEHTLLLGGDYYNQSGSPSGVLGFAEIPPIDIFDRIHTGFTRPPAIAGGRRGVQ